MGSDWEKVFNKLLFIQLWLFSTKYFIDVSFVVLTIHDDDDEEDEDDDDDDDNDDDDDDDDDVDDDDDDDVDEDDDDDDDDDDEFYEILWFQYWVTESKWRYYYKTFADAINTRLKGMALYPALG